MFTINPFDLVDRNDPNAKIPIDALPPQLVKLTDFGLARFIDPASPRLETRCGSESFAAPEIIMGLSYDGRDTDAWAVGVILFALVTCELPFDRTSERNGSGLSHRSAYHTPDDDDASRRKQLMRIARGAYDWPTGKGSEGVKRVVAKLLVRDPARRSRIDRALWDEIWMNGPGSLPAPEAYDPSAPAIFDGRGRRRLLDGYVIDSETMDFSV
jgi:tRNA (cytidine32/guanosine34-2'-O)-methyltransferase